ncbi:hypothetical protein CYMTET_6110 [Cymbomonas tetramitiformis]|uniref:DUF4201 domain-containing protein n=1 Tax=Cymbomonas tetramitiformis TaxID=36881 RepID=A0AAE0L2P8_9CHLO|nr:hypothetical protein CYMTET_21947 [Cymbomonas tetramitiformis]KAK3286328.1 hypothetical protein CYMTET_6110 [Cymbomonas tetramitiformis]
MGGFSKFRKKQAANFKKNTLTPVQLGAKGGRGDSKTLQQEVAGLLENFSSYSQVENGPTSLVSLLNDESNFEQLSAEYEASVAAAGRLKEEVVEKARKEDRARRAYAKLFDADGELRISAHMLDRVIPLQDQIRNKPPDGFKAQMEFARVTDLLSDARLQGRKARYEINQLNAENASLRQRVKTLESGQIVKDMKLELCQEQESLSLAQDMLEKKELAVNSLKGKLSQFQTRITSEVLCDQVDKRMKQGKKDWSDRMVLGTRQLGALTGD